MFDLKLLREDPEALKRAVAAKKADVDIDRLVALDSRRRELIQQTEQGQAAVNAASKQIGARIKAGEDPETAKAEVRRLKDELEAARNELAAVQSEFDQLCLRVPNPPHPTTPLGTSEEDNQVVADWGSKPSFDFTQRPHWEIGEALGILDLARGTKITGSGSPYSRLGRDSNCPHQLFHPRAHDEFGCVRSARICNSATMRNGSSPRWQATCIASGQRGRPVRRGI